MQDYLNIDQVQFITNVINTKALGIDIVMNGVWRLNKATVGFTAAANFTQTKLCGDIQTTDKLPGVSANGNTLFDRNKEKELNMVSPQAKSFYRQFVKKAKQVFYSAAQGWKNIYCVGFR